MVLLWSGFCLLATSALEAAENPELRYGFADGDRSAYAVKIEAQLDDEDVIHEGVLTYVVRSATPEQFVITVSGALGEKHKPRGDHRGFPPAPPRFPIPGMGGPSFAGPPEATLNRRGEVLVSRELAPLPYLLGDKELLVFEMLPNEPRPQWVNERNVAVMERSSTGPFPSFLGGGPFGATTTERTATERTEYSLRSSQAGVVQIAKAYTLRTRSQQDSSKQLEVTGSGEFVFDGNRGLIQSIAMNYTIVVTDGNLTRRVPVTLACRHLSQEELAERQQQEAAARAKAEEARAAANAPRPFAPGERAALLRDLKLSDPWRLRAAADRLAKAPVDEQANEIAEVLASLLGHSDAWVQGAAAKALVVWAAPEAQEALIEASRSENLWVRAAAIEALGKLKTVAAAEAVAAQMYRNRSEAGKALRAMGEVAEDAAIGGLSDRDRWVRKEACQILSDIGGLRALDALEAYRQRAAGFELGDAEQAMNAIRARLKADGAPGGTASAATSPGVREYRIWRDSSGIFEIEAIMVDSSDDTVTLKKRSGGTATISLDRLSESDRAYVAANAGK